MILNFKKFNCIIISCLMIVVMSFSFFISIKHFSDELATLESHSVYLASHLNYHERDNQHNEHDADDEETGHSHTHRHSEGEEEHTHKHINVVTFSEMILFQTNSLLVLSFDIHNSTPKSYKLLISNPFKLEILRPPINS